MTDSFDDLVTKGIRSWDILMASPYDQTFDFGRQITEEIFAQHFRILDEFVTGVVSRIETALVEDGSPYVGALLIGHSGIGKTTIIHYFMEKHTGNTEFTPVNMAGPTSDMAFDPSAQAGRARRARTRSESAAEHSSQLPRDSLEAAGASDAQPLHKVLLNEHNTPYLIRCITFLRSHYLSTYTDLPPSLSIALNSARDDDANLHGTVVAQLDIVGSLTVLLLCTMARFVDDNRNQHVLILDNIDAISTNHIERLFREWLAVAIDSARTIWRHDHFAADVTSRSPQNKDRLALAERKCRLLFSIRDANYTITNTHRMDRLPLIRALHVSMPRQTHANILKSRIELVRRLAAASARPLNQLDAVSETIDVLFRGKEFAGILDRMFNGDYRASARAITQCIYEDDLINIREIFGKQGPSADDRASAFLHYMMRYLDKIEFMDEYNRLFLLHYKKSQGYCHHIRMILNVIRNLSSPAGEHIVSPTHRVSADSASLLNVLEALDGVFPPREVVETIALIFSFYSLGWAQMVSVYGVNIVDPVELDEILEDVEFYRSTRTNVTALKGKGVSERYSLVRMKLATIHIAICPAGDYFVDRLVHNFEFYAVLADPRDGSLFVNGLDRFDPAAADTRRERSLQLSGDSREDPDPQYRFKFEKIVTSVLDIVSGHARVTKIFYSKTIRVPKDQYLESERCYWPSVMRTGRFRVQGRFHVSRVVLNHIDTLLKFVVFASKSLDGRDDIEFVEMRIRGFVAQYCAILRQSDFLDAEARNGLEEYENWLQSSGQSTVPARSRE